jgi:hypothetical protein
MSRETLTMKLNLTGHEVSSPTRARKDLIAYEKECRDALRPALTTLLDAAEGVGWDRKIAAATLMFLASQHVTAAMNADSSR